jgi:hypothetical protein
VLDVTLLDEIAHLPGAEMGVTAKSLVERFYNEVWNRADESVAREILHPDFWFRASLGPERHGPDGFDYMRLIHAALANYTSIIDDLIATENRAAARMTFKGIHHLERVCILQDRRPSDLELWCSAISTV